MSRMHTQGDNAAPNGRELLDAYFDGEIDRAGKGRLHDALRHDPVLAEEFSRTSEAVSMLRQSGSNSGLDIDLTERVLARCDAQRGYLNKRGRRFVVAGRTAVALATLVMAAGVVVFIRMTPPGLRLPERERPIGVLLESGNADAHRMRMVPPSVQRDLADSVDQSKVERTIVFDLPADSARDFSAFRPTEGDSGEARAMARLPMFPRWDAPADASDWASGPLPMDAQRAASVVRSPGASPLNWWERPQVSPLIAEPVAPLADHRGAWLLLRRVEPRSGARDGADRE